MFISIHFSGKKVLDHTALAGLAAKLDFSTVKLKKTVTIEHVRQYYYILLKKSIRTLSLF